MELPPSPLRVSRNVARERRTGARSSAARSAYRLRFVRAPRVEGRPPLGVEVHGAAAGRLEVGEVERLVLRVGVARGILEPDQEGGRAAERLRERPDEGDAAARADLDGRAPVAGPERALRRVERRTDGRRCSTRGPPSSGVMRSSSPHGTFAFRCATSARATLSGPARGRCARPTRRGPTARSGCSSPATGDASSAVIASDGSYHCAAYVAGPAASRGASGPHGPGVPRNGPLVEGQRGEALALGRSWPRLAPASTPGHRDAPVGLRQGREQPGHPHHRVGDRAAPEAAVERVGVAAQLDLDLDEPAQPRRERRQPRLEVARCR